MSTNNNSPRVSPTERYLAKRAERFTEPSPAMLVWMADTAVQLPQELALSLIRRRKVSPIVDPLTVPALILTEDDMEGSDLNLWDAETVAA
jgi:hypothetical protein